MIDHVWTVVCSRAVTDPASNSVSLESIIEQITFYGEPPPNVVVAVHIEVLTLWARSDPNVPAGGEERLSLIAPNGDSIGSMVREVNLTSTYQRFRSRFIIEGIILRGQGRYLFRVELRREGQADWSQVANIPLDVFFSAPPAEFEEVETA